MTAVGAFLLLRFFNPALILPDRVGLVITGPHADRNRRGLKQASKVYAASQDARRSKMAPGHSLGWSHDPFLLHSLLRTRAAAQILQMFFNNPLAAESRGPLAPVLQALRPYGADTIAYLTALSAPQGPAHSQQSRRASAGTCGLPR